MTSAELKYVIAINELYNGTAGIKLTEIAAKMNVTKVSAYKAAERLEKNGYIRRDEKNKVVMTEYGYEQLNKYSTLIEWLSSHLKRNFNVSAETAYHDAIGVACALSEESRCALAEFIGKAK